MRNIASKGKYFDCLYNGLHNLDKLIAGILLKNPAMKTFEKLRVMIEEGKKIISEKSEMKDFYKRFGTLLSKAIDEHGEKDYIEITLIAIEYDHILNTCSKPCIYNPLLERAVENPLVLINGDISAEMIDCNNWSIDNEVEYNTSLNLIRWDINATLKRDSDIKLVVNGFFNIWNKGEYPINIEEATINIRQGMKILLSNESYNAENILPGEKVSVLYETVFNTDLKEFQIEVAINRLSLKKDFCIDQIKVCRSNVLLSVENVTADYSNFNTDIGGGTGKEIISESVMRYVTINPIHSGQVYIAAFKLTDPPSTTRLKSDLKIFEFITYPELNLISCGNVLIPGIIDPEQKSTFCTYSQEEIKDLDLEDLDLEIRNLKFTSSAAIKRFLPQTGSPSFFTGKLINPLYTDAGILAGQVVTLAINIRLDDKFGDLILSDKTLLTFPKNTDLIGKSIKEIYDIAERIMTGEDVTYSYSDISNLLEFILTAFPNCSPSPFSLNLN